MGQVIKQPAELTIDKKGFGCAKLVVFCNAVEDNPFMAGAFHGVGESDTVINVGVSGPGVVQRALEKVRGESFDVVADTIKNTAFDLKGEAKGVMQNLEDKKDELVEEYKEEEYHRKLREHVDKEEKNDDFRDNSFK